MAVRRVMPTWANWLLPLLATALASSGPELFTCAWRWWSARRDRGVRGPIPLPLVESEPVQHLAADGPCTGACGLQVRREPAVGPVIPLQRDRESSLVPPAGADRLAGMSA
ncbi:hypothetical protein D5S17_36035 [Pseudonocardiaceae bacterium YIM PH 21723]|nr:hypothetical protein D5S17_36035 [Pseudonocardiaceae bacterium YIM PH 21723]